MVSVRRAGIREGLCEGGHIYSNSLFAAQLLLSQAASSGDELSWCLTSRARCSARMSRGQGAVHKAPGGGCGVQGGLTQVGKLDRACMEPGAHLSNMDGRVGGCFGASGICGKYSVSESALAPRTLRWVGRLVAHVDGLLCSGQQQSPEVVREMLMKSEGWKRRADDPWAGHQEDGGGGTNGSARQAPASTPILVRLFWRMLRRCWPLL